MTAYILIDRLSITDAIAFGPYQPLASTAVARYGGRYLLPHDTEIKALEGSWKPNQVVVIQFDHEEGASAWWDSREYAEARAIHRQAAIANTILISGDFVTPELQQPEVTWR